MLVPTAANKWGWMDSVSHQTHLGGYVVQVPIEAFTPKSAEVPGRWEVLWLPMSTGGLWWCE